MKDLSVIICTFNRADILAGALDALASQTITSGTSWELIVVDNNSRDHTSDLVHRFCASAPMPTTYVFEGRQGKSFAMNSGATAAAGRVLALTDDDCRPTGTWVQDVLDGLARHGAQGLGGRILPHWDGPRPAWLREDQSHLMDSLALLTDAKVREVISGGAWERTHGTRVWGANMAFTREAFFRVGGFDVSMGPRGAKKYSHEDIEFVRRVLGKGFRVFFDPAPTVYHRIGPDRMQKKFFRSHSFFLGEGTALKHPPDFRHVLGVSPHLVGKLLRDATACAGGAIRGDSRAFEMERSIFEDLGLLSGSVRTSIKTGTWAKLRRTPRRRQEEV